MAGEVAAGAIGALGGLIGQGWAQTHDEKMAREQQKWNEQMWQKQAKRSEDFWQRQQDWNLAQWERQNEYNSPVEQMARLQEAGLNPNLIYGQGAQGATGMATPASSAAAGNAGDIKGYSRAQSRNVLSGLKDFGEIYRLQNLNAQTDNVRSNTALTDEKTLHEKIRKALTSSKRVSQDLHNYVKGETFEWDIANAEMGVRLKEMQYDLDRQEVEWRMETMSDRIAQETYKKDKWKWEATNLETINGIRELERSWKKFENERRMSGIENTDELWMRQMYNDPDYRGLISRWAYVDKGAKTVGNFINFLKVGGLGSKKRPGIRITEKYDSQGVFQGGTHSYTE